MEEEDPGRGKMWEVSSMVPRRTSDKQHLDEGGIPSKPGG